MLICSSVKKKLAGACKMKIMLSAQIMLRLLTGVVEY